MPARAFVLRSILTPIRPLAWSVRRRLCGGWQAAALLVLLCVAGMTALAPVPAAAATQEGPGAQRLGRIATMIEGVKAAGRNFRTVEPFRARMRANAHAASTRAALRDGLVLSVNHHALRAVLNEGAKDILLVLPGIEGGTVALELTEVNFLTPDFRVVTASAPDQAVVHDKGLHFWGVVQGDPGSLAAVSVFRNEVMGIYRTPSHGTVVLGRLGGENPLGEHVLYAEKDLTAKNPFVCGTTGKVSDFVQALSEATQTLSEETLSAEAATPTAAASPVRIYFEADYDIYQNKGNSVGAVTDFVTGLFGQSAILYQNDGVAVALSALFVWDKGSPYTGILPEPDGTYSPGQFLATFQSYRTSFDGDLGHLLAFRGNGGVAASLNGFCNADRSQSQCFSGVHTSFAQVPQYSWSVNLVTHEMGHLMGSPHTHACFWNGNNTAIDGCAGYTEDYGYGTCPKPGFPPNGGTIMSYCHQVNQVGVNFNNGFGPQPGELIRSRVAGAGCFSPTNKAAFVSQSVPTSMVAGQLYGVSVTMQNTGTTTWTKSALYRLGSQNPQDNGTWGVSRVELPVDSVGQGVPVTFNFTVTAPSTAGSYNFQWRMLRELVEWFGDLTPNVAVSVQPSGPPPAPSGLTAWFDILSRTMRLKWVDNSSNEQGFQVQFSYSGSAFADLSPPTVGANVTTYTSGANPPLGSYQFRVRSFGGGLYSAWSNVPSLIVPAPVSGYKGCYTDSATRALPVMLGGTTHTIESCKQAAFNAAYKYAGVQWYGYCFGGNTLGYTLVSDSECNTPCSSNPAQMCGGGWRNSIYDTGYTPPPVAPAAPSGLTAWFDGPSRTTRLAWTDNSTNEQGFQVQFSYSGSAFADMSPPTVGANVTSYTSGANPPSGSYQFRVRAFASGLYSAWSNVPSLIVPAPVPASTSIAWIQPAESSWGPAGTLTAAGYASNGSGAVQLVFRERADNGVWGAWQTVPYQAPVSADGTWSNAISSGSPTNKCHYFDAYVNYSGVTSAVFQYTGWTGCP